MCSISAQSFTVARPLLAVALLVGCQQDFMLHEKSEIVIGEDTGVTLEESDAPDLDTGFEQEEEDSTGPGDGTAVPEDEAPVDDTTGPDEDEEEEPVEDDPAPEDDCESTSDLIYVLDKDASSLSTFDPDTLTLTTLGTLDCDTWSTPASMGVARDGVGYVRFGDNEVFSVDLETLDCTSTSYSERASEFGSFGMGFATESAHTWRDQLFVANSRQLGRIDPTTWQVTTLGTLPSQAELTGTGDGELWGVLPLESPMTVVELDHATGSVLQTIRVGTTLDISNLDTFAFAAWDGDFYLFARYYGMGSSTEVYRIDRSGSITKVVDELGINVVGAGVSTCAPT
jgi:hypothetical protein